MKLLLDQDVYAVTHRFLNELGHDIQTAADLGLSRSPDRELLRTAQTLGRILVTRDRDYGSLVFVSGLGGGVLYLRMALATIPEVHGQLAVVLNSHTQQELAEAFVVVEAGQYRFRKVRSPHD